MHYRRACYDLKRKKGATKPQVTTLTTSSEHNSNKNMEEKLFLSAYVCVCAFYFAAAAAAGGIEDTVPRRTYICAKPKTSSTHSMQLAALFFPSFYCKTSRSRKKKKKFSPLFRVMFSSPVFIWFSFFCCFVMYGWCCDETYLGRWTLLHEAQEGYVPESPYFCGTAVFFLFGFLLPRVIIDPVWLSFLFFFFLFNFLLASS